jgi:hypothetical protein
MNEGNEGCYAWYLQGNRVADETPTIYSVTWSKFGEPIIGPGAGDGKGFIEMLQPGDRIVVWGRTKVIDRYNKLSQSFNEPLILCIQRLRWENHVHEVHVDIRVDI